MGGSVIRTTEEALTPAIGYRVWRVDPDDSWARLRIQSLLSETAWPFREKLSAVCEPRLVPPWHRRRLLGGLPRHPAPVSECSCGVYSYHDAHAMLRQLKQLHQFNLPRPGFEQRLLVGGAVLCWGRIAIHPEGLRAQFVRPLAFTLPPATPVTRPAEDHLRQVAEAYAVPLVEMEHLVDYAQEFGSNYQPATAGRTLLTLLRRMFRRFIPRWLGRSG